MRTALALTLLLVLSGCSDTATPTDAPVPAAARGDVFGMAPADATPVDIDAMTDEERDAYGLELMRLRIDLQKAMATPGGWEAVDRATRPLIDAFPTLNQFEVAQTAATMMLRTHLLTGSDGAEKAEAIGFYTSLLVEHGSPNAPLVERALASLEGHWPDRQIASVATRAADAGDRYVATMTDCEDCDRPALAQRAATSADVRTVQIGAAADRLRERAR